ncbi:hypothetical protein GQX74_013630 [Glossina fuscipes]|nr:hypothetical protein GQX74_013630 [Glossina fuscipes]
MVSTVIVQLLDALQYLHWHGYCHFNLQPDNIVMTSGSIMQLILGELPLTDGGVVINGVISYAAQEPWLLSDERGASLSEGQRARISLARAIYKPASIYLLDDLLNAVDTHVGRHRFEEVIGPRSCLAQQNISRILITHQGHFLNEADWIIIIENGRISRQGTYKDGS